MLRFDSLARAGFWLASAVILYLALEPVPPQLPASDKTQHIVAFATLTMLSRIGYLGLSGWTLALAMTGFGAAIELLQTLPIFVRDGSWADLAADLLAIALGLAAATPLVPVLERYWPTRLRWRTGWDSNPR